MSNSLNGYSARASFAQLNKKICASDYISQKKNKYSFCSPNICHPNKNIYSFEKYYGLKKANLLTFNPCSIYFDKTQLYSGLYNKLDLQVLADNTPVISNSMGTFPVTIDPNDSNPFLHYNVDPSGNLFGNNACGIDNYLHYVVYDFDLNEL
jgi:hypothetical protein